MHLVDRSLGGCDDPDCVVPATREEHDAYDAGELDLLPYLIRNKNQPGHLRELKHALEHCDGSLLRLIHKITGRRHVPESEAT